MSGSVPPAPAMKSPSVHSMALRSACDAECASPRIHASSGRSSKQRRYKHSSSEGRSSHHHHLEEGHSHHQHSESAHSNSVHRLFSDSEDESGEVEIASPFKHHHTKVYSKTTRHIETSGDTEGITSQIESLLRNNNSANSPFKRTTTTIIKESKQQQSTFSNGNSKLASPQSRSSWSSGFSSGYDTEEKEKTDYTYAKSFSYRSQATPNRECPSPNMSRTSLYRHSQSSENSQLHFLSSDEDEHDEEKTIRRRSSTSHHRSARSNNISSNHHSTILSSGEGTSYGAHHLATVAASARGLGTASASSSHTTSHTTIFKWFKSLFSWTNLSQRSWQERSRSLRYTAVDTHRTSWCSPGCLCLLFLIPFVLLLALAISGLGRGLVNQSAFSQVLVPLSNWGFFTGHSVVYHQDNQTMDLRHLVKTLLHEELQMQQAATQTNHGLYQSQLDDLSQNIRSIHHTLNLLTQDLEVSKQAHQESQDERQALKDNTMNHLKKLNGHIQELYGMMMEVRNCCLNQSEYILAAEKRLGLLLKDVIEDGPDGHAFSSWLKETFVLKQEYQKSLKEAASALNHEKTASSKVVIANTSTNLDALVKTTVQRALAQYDADKTGLADYALESAGGSIVSTRCSEAYQERSAQFSIFGIPLWHYSHSPRKVIQPGVTPGECWPFRGSQGYLVIQLATPIIPTAFTLEHIPASLSPTGVIDSAPRDFSVLGLASETETEGVLLGRYTYDKDGEPLQTFEVQIPNPGRFPYIELRIESNHGNLEYTCLYRFRVHGIRGPH